MYTADDVNDLNIVLNGDDLTGSSTITNQLIGDSDRLLVSYGNMDKVALDTQYKAVPSTAGEYNHKQDPAGCGGNHEVTIGDRFKNLF